MIKNNFFFLMQLKIINFFLLLLLFILLYFSFFQVKRGEKDSVFFSALKIRKNKLKSWKKIRGLKFAKKKNKNKPKQTIWLDNANKKLYILNKKKIENYKKKCKKNAKI